MKAQIATLVIALFAFFLCPAQVPERLFVFAHSGEVYSVSFSPDQNLILTASQDKLAGIWDRNTGKLLHKLSGHSGAVTTAMFSPDGKQILTASFDKSDKVAILWETATGKKIRELSGHYSGISCAAYSPNGEFIATGSSDYSIILWRAKDGKYLGTLKGHSGVIGEITGITDLEFSKDSKYIVSASQDNTAKVWEVPSGRLVVNLTGHRHDVKGATFSNNARTVLTASSDKTIKVWDVATGSILNDIKNTALLHTISLTPDNTDFVTSDWNQKIKVWDTSNGTLKRTLATNTSPGGGVYTYKDFCLAKLTADGRFLVTATKNPQAEFWDFNAGKKLFSFNGHNQRVYAVDISKDNQYAVTGSLDGEVILWKLPITPEIVIPKPTLPPNLEITSVKYADGQGDNNNVLNANEAASLTASIINSGKGEAYNIVAEVNNNSTAQGVQFLVQKQVSNLKPGDSLKIVIPIVAGFELRDGELDINLKVREGNGFDSEPIKVSIKTEKFKNPLVTIADHKFSNNQGGKIKLGQAVLLELLLQNKGQGKANKIKVTFRNPPNIFAGSENEVLIEELLPNETRILSYEFFANKAFTLKDIPIEVIITESYGNYGDNQTLSVSLDQTLQQTKTVVVSNQVQNPIKIDDVFLNSQQEQVQQETRTLEMEVVKTGKPVFYSLFIGINDYEYSSANIPDLDKPIVDAEALQETLITKYQFTKEHSVILKNPTRSEIINTLEDLAIRITPKDNLLIFYAGHGIWDDRLKKGYWLPADSRTNDVSTWIPNSTIKDYIAGIQSKHTLLITDACFGGGIFKTRDVNAEINELAVSKIYRLASRKAMTSGTLTTVPDDSKFMRSLIRRLNDAVGDYITSRMLFDQIYTAVVNDTNTVPQFGVIQETGDEGGDFIFIKRKTSK